jgi:thiamine-monophosphate kinase
VNEFELIDEIVRTLGAAARGGVIGPGDDCCAIRPPQGELLISSIDTLVSGVHFPADAPGNPVGYRSIMVALSDLAAMGATPAQILIGMTLETTDQVWALDVARGMSEAVLGTDARLLGGNLARGPRSITASVHGFCPEESVLTRSGAKPGDGLYVTGALGAAAAAVALDKLSDLDDPRTERYFHPRARLDAGIALRGQASSAIDVSDGLFQDLEHLCSASGVGADLEVERIPIAEGSALDHALHGGDDYELLFSAPSEPDIELEVVKIGTVSKAGGIRLDGEPVTIKGYQHFL